MKLKLLLLFVFLFNLPAISQTGSIDYTQFYKLKARCDIEVIEIFGAENFKKNLRLNFDKNEIEWYEKRNPKKISSVTFTYEIVMDSAVIYDFEVTCYDDYFIEMFSETRGRWTCIGYSYLLNDKFEIGYYAAKEIALKNGMQPNNNSLRLNYSAGNVKDYDSYTWHVDLGTKGNTTTSLYINPQTGVANKTRFVLVEKK